MPRRVLILGASYGSLLGTKLAMAGHDATLVCRQATADLINATCLVGTKDELIEKLRALDEAGLNQVMNLPSFDPRFEVLETIAKEIIPYV